MIYFISIFEKIEFLFFNQNRNFIPPTSNSLLMKENVNLELILPVTLASVYEAWLDGQLHSAMTDGEATCSNVEGETYSTWDGYITGTNLKIVPNSLIEQSWRTADFSDSDEDSHLKIEFNEHPDGMKLTLTHTNIPEGQTQYEQGWKENYFEPMTRFFSEYTDF
mgnify:CR=1 FL=1